MVGAVAVEYLLTRTGAAASGWQWMAAGRPGLFWVAVYGVVAGVMPLRLMESLRGESDGRNAELLLMGGLTRWQIVRGKWMPQAVLTLLSLVSPLPYMLVRYFFGEGGISALFVFVFLSDGGGPGDVRLRDGGQWLCHAGDALFNHRGGGDAPCSSPSGSQRE